ncbi:MAG: helix-turn-helix domain-containing protein [Candidatus Aminicenantes bacterium]|nr:helix-turn-helix domain-containing protein [Candidatus Aminicenantes bacterium]NIM81961.1 helix-turn-helix domain-containing protein [Candidatus Aminicenantes bacterium]NIN21349.1 helix-turn-helix domain-containing protein [Candidatus Aminicenantes bacterium]NIN45170.1 helix-turn-helix domain-containing protein [Candidatus Aminicenantes bacterium]NIN87987.1 helix-turn-helix domain-containing protein [Candidatus Aminicenantes bacterium]
MKEKQKNKLSRRAAQKVDNASTEELAAMTVNSLANELDVTPEHLSRTFTADYECHLKDYIEDAKMNKAEDLLKNTDLQVKEIAKRLDYSKPGYFSDVFKKHKGVSPKKYRENHNSQPEKEIQPPKEEESIWQIFKNKIIKYFQAKVHY